MHWNARGGCGMINEDCCVCAWIFEPAVVLVVLIMKESGRMLRTRWCSVLIICIRVVKQLI